MKLKKIAEDILGGYLNETKQVSDGIWYHGGQTKIKNFIKTQPINRRGNTEGFYFTKNIDYARSHGNEITVVNLKVKNSFIIGKTNVSENMIHTYAIELHKENDHLPLEGSWIKGKCEYFKDKKYMPYTGLNGLSQQIIYKSGGFDSVIDGHEICVFDSNDIIVVSNIDEGVRLNDDNTYFFDFKEDKKDDMLTLTYNKNYLMSKKKSGIISYFSYKINKKIDKTIRFNLLNYIKNNLKNSNNYDVFLTKSILGLFNNPNIEVGDVDLILIPESSSSLNLDLANKIKNKIPNALFLKDIILKNEPENVLVDYDLLKEKKYSKETILQIEDMVKKATINGVFKIKKIAPRFRKYILNFLKIDVTNRMLLNKLVNGKIIVVDDITTEGTTFKEINRLMQNYAPKEIILFTLIG